MKVSHDQQFFFLPEKGPIGKQDQVLTEESFFFEFRHMPKESI
jgi:hypothetical protein